MKHVVELRLSILERAALLWKSLRLVLEMRRLGYSLSWSSGCFQYHRRLFDYSDSPELWIEEVYGVVCFQLRSEGSLVRQWVLRSDVESLANDAVRFEGSDELESQLRELDCPPVLGRSATPLM